MAETTAFRKKHPLVVLLLIIITFGLYIPVWYIRTWPALSRLDTPTKPIRGLPYALLLLDIAILALALAPDAPLLSTLARSAWIEHMHYFATAPYLLLNWFLAVRVVDILYEHSDDGLTSRYMVSWLRACFLSVIYLQYEINRLPVTVRGVRSNEEIAVRHGL